MTRRTPAEALKAAEHASARLIGESGDLLRWEWDSRFSAVLSVVKVPNDRPVLELAGAVFTADWNEKTIGGAPEPVRALAATWGLNPGQRLFTLDPEDDPLLFAAWWPWGSGTTASLRIATYAREAADPVAELRRWFSLK